MAFGAETGLCAPCDDVGSGDEVVKLVVVACHGFVPIFFGDEEGGIGVVSFCQIVPNDGGVSATGCIVDGGLALLVFHGISSCAVGGYAGGTFCRGCQVERAGLVDVRQGGGGDGDSVHFAAAATLASCSPFRKCDAAHGHGGGVQGQCQDVLLACLQSELR